MKKIYTEIGLFVLTNILFYSLTNPIQEIVKHSFNLYGKLDIKSVIGIIFIILLLIIGVIYGLVLISKKYKKLGLLSFFNIITSVFWAVLLIATMDYSLGWNRFHTAEHILVVSFYIIPLTFAITALIYKMKNK